MSSHRLAQIQSVLQHDLAVALHQMMTGTEGLVSISFVEVQPDLRAARVMVSVASKNRGPEVLAMLEKHRKELQTNISKKHRFKYTPILTFEIERGEQSDRRVQELLDRM